MSLHHIHIHDSWLERFHPRKKSGEFTAKGTGETGGAGASHGGEVGSVPVRAAKPTKQAGLQSSALPIIDLPQEKGALIRLEAMKASHAASRGEGPGFKEMSIPLSEIASFQEVVEKSKLKSMQKKFKTEAELDRHPTAPATAPGTAPATAPADKPRVIKIGSKYVLVDGNHRANAALLNGHKKLEVNYLGNFTDMRWQ